MQFLLALGLAVSIAFADEWNRQNDPSNFNDSYQYTLSALPLKAELPKNKMPWSSSYWPRMKGSINYRWNTPSPRGFNLDNPSKARVATMTQQELAALSPAEKWDLAQGHYNYPLSTRVAAGATPNAKDYEGVCDGWTASAIQFTEPAPVTVKNPDGIEIPFGSSDVKALMSYDVSLNDVDLSPTFIGKYCVIRLQAGACADINPGAFHVVLANQIGLMQESFAVDIDPGRETWNQPVFGFEFEIRGETSSRGAARAYIIHATIKYAEDDPEGEDAHKVFNWNPTIGTDGYAAAQMEVDYVLEVDYAGRIIGGEWLGSSKRAHPDLFWLPTKKIKWSKDFEFINQIYRPAF